jgi:hypothetical protein
VISNLKELQNVLKLCRKFGVTELELNGTKIKLGELPSSRQEVEEEVYEESEMPAVPTNEQLIEWAHPILG